jgi:pyruvate dehydrogenase E2 component (dihydrolipoamide acetyltransferase)
MQKSRGSIDFEPPYVEVAAPAIRKVIAQRLLESKLTIPHFHLFDEIDMEEAALLRGELNR